LGVKALINNTARLVAGLCHNGAIMHNFFPLQNSRLHAAELQLDFNVALVKRTTSVPHGWFSG